MPRHLPQTLVQTQYESWVAHRHFDDGRSEARLIQLQVPGSLPYRHVVVATVEAACRLAHAGVDASARARLAQELTSAVGEAFNNIAVHGYRGRAPGLVRVDLDVGVEWITVELRDFGTSFDPTRGAPDAPDLGTLPESGMGIFIMQSFVERATYLPGSPNVLTLAKRIPGG